jgi:uncharacterized protein (DUF1015 family)
VADVKPFRAVRYTGALDSLVAPPYDVISPAERDAYAARDPHNVVRLTLPESEDEAARLWGEWLDLGILAEDGDPSAWVLSQDYVGPDGVARTRNGVVAALRLEPYENRVVLPHERTHSGPKEGRLRLLRAVRAQLEPIFLLHEGAPPVTPSAPPDVEAEGTRLWRAGAGVLAGFEGQQLLIADGHHRYETALAFHAEDGTEASSRMMVVLVGMDQPGVTIFATHRTAKRAAVAPSGGDLEAALDSLAAEPPTRAALVAYTPGGAVLMRGGEGELDPELVESFAPEGIAYTPSLEDAVAAVDSGEAEAAFLLRPALVEQVWERARRGEVMPQKSTYFFPKLLSGLLFQPL